MVVFRPFNFRPIKYSTTTTSTTTTTPTTTTAATDATTTTTTTPTPVQISAGFVTDQVFNQTTGQGYFPFQQFPQYGIFGALNGGGGFGQSIGGLARPNIPLLFRPFIGGLARPNNGGFAGNYPVIGGVATANG